MTTSSRCEKAGCEAGGQGQQGRRRVAARHGDPGGSAEGVPLSGQFREAVRPGSGMGGSVELLPRGRVLEAVVGAGIDHDGTGWQLRGDLRGRSVRQGQEDDIVPGEILHRGVLEDAVGQAVEMRLQFP